MTTAFHRNSILIAVLICGLFAPAWSDAITFDRVVVFGASISDPGNAFALTGEAIKPPYDELDLFLVPGAPYAKGGHHFSNGATWIEQYAKPRGLGKYVGAAFADGQSHALNYAIGGARARHDGINVNFSDQLTAFLTDVGNVAPSDALYVIDLGANDVRDALVAGDPSILADALNSIAANLGGLYAVGARKFLVLNVANLGVLPSIRILDGIFPGAAAGATVLSQVFNANLDAVTAFIAAFPGVEMVRLDLYQIVNGIMADPTAFGLTETDEACITPDEAPFTCKKPDQVFFWDGIHPTKAVHGILAQQAADVLGQ
jgi:phospholipase/lecithinase/hemolysin